jgi:thiol-disulfide isomerase/thioredoxin
MPDDPLEFNDNHFINLSLHEKDTILMFVDEDKLEEPFMKVFREASAKFVGDNEIQFGYTTMTRDPEVKKMGSDGMGDRMAYSLDMEIEEQPSLVAINGGDYRPLYLKPDLDALKVEDFDAFVQDLKMNTTKHYLKTQKPFNNTGKSLISLVGSDFWEHVTDKTKHYFVMVYNNLCGDCKKMAPVWMKLAKEYDNNSEVVVAKLDAEKNHVENLHIGYFPTFLYYPKGADPDAEGISYDGKAYEATFNDLTKWVELCISGGCKPNKEPG